MATWISPKVAVFVTKLANRFLTGELTTEESKAAAAQVDAAFNIRKAPQELVAWHKQRDDGRRATTLANAAIHGASKKATGRDYAMISDAVNWAATGRKTKQLRAELGIKGTPRNHMAAGQLSMVAYMEAVTAETAGEKLRELQGDVPPRLLVDEAGRLAMTTFEYTRDTGGHTMRLLARAPPTIAQVDRALQAAAPNKRQRLVLEKAEMKPVAALPAPLTVNKGIQKYFRTVPMAVPDSALDLYD